MLFVPKNDTMWVLFLAVLVIFTRAPQLVVSSRASMSSLRSISDLFGHKVVNQLQLYVSTMIYFQWFFLNARRMLMLLGRKRRPN